MPTYVSYGRAIDVVKQRKDWILKHISKVKEAEKLRIQFDENTFFHTRNHRLILTKWANNNISGRVTKNKINVKYPENTNVKSMHVQQAIRTGIDNALRIEAKEFIPIRVSDLANKFGFTYNKITIKNIKSMWGSCSSKNNLNFSLHIMRLPEHLIDYI